MLKVFGVVLDINDIFGMKIVFRLGSIVVELACVELIVRAIGVDDVIVTEVVSGRQDPFYGVDEPLCWKPSLLGFWIQRCLSVLRHLCIATV